MSTLMIICPHYRLGEILTHSYDKRIQYSIYDSLCKKNTKNLLNKIHNKERIYVVKRFSQDVICRSAHTNLCLCLALACPHTSKNFGWSYDFGTKSDEF